MHRVHCASAKEIVSSSIPSENPTQTRLKSNNNQEQFRMSEGQGNTIRVFVDAKITGMHDKKLPKLAYVGYLVEGSGLHAAKPVEAEESDDAEIQAVLFAIEELGLKFDRITIVCDHESVVSEASRETVKKPSPLLDILRATLRANSSRIQLEALQHNLAHGILTEYVNQVMRNATSE